MMGREQHPAKARRQARTTVHDAATINAWWSAEQAAATESVARTRFYNAAVGCLFVMTVCVVVAVVLAAVNQ